MESSGDAILIGYFPKRVLSRPVWLKAPQVVEICSVSECMSAGPDDWMERWLHNEMACFDSPAIAGDIIAADAKDEFDTFAYRLFPTIFSAGKASGFSVPPLSVEPLPDSYGFLGFDVVSRCGGHHFDCSPLSCNGAAESESVNEHCLLTSEQEACRLAAEASDAKTGFEPGPYFVVEVWRDS